MNSNNEQWEIAADEFHHITSMSGGIHAPTYKSSNGLEFIAWYESEEDIPAPEHKLIETVVTEVEEYAARYKFQMTLPYEVESTPETSGLRVTVYRTVTHPSYQVFTASVIVYGFDKLTPRAARAACRIAFGNDGGMVWSLDDDYGYRVYAKSARKIHHTF